MGLVVYDLLSVRAGPAQYIIKTTTHERTAVAAEALHNRTWRTLAMTKRSRLMQHMSVAAFAGHRDVLCLKKGFNGVNREVGSDDTLITKQHEFRAHQPATSGAKITRRLRSRATDNAHKLCSCPNFRVRCWKRATVSVAVSLAVRQLLHSLLRLLFLTHSGHLFNVRSR